MNCGIAQQNRANRKKYLKRKAAPQSNATISTVSLQIQKAYKFRLKLGSRKARKLTCTLGCCRFVWNKLLATQKGLLDWNLGILPYAGLCELLPGWKHQLPWLQEPPSQTLQQVAKDLSRALKNAFDPQMPQAFPQFKKKGQDASCGVTIRLVLLQTSWS
jgi:transposase